MCRFERGMSVYRCGQSLILDEIRYLLLDATAFVGPGAPYRIVCTVSIYLMAR